MLRAEPGDDLSPSAPPIRDTVTRIRRWASGSPTREVCMTVYIGIDWSQAQHDVCFLDAADAPIARDSAAQPERLRPLRGVSAAPGNATQSKQDNLPRLLHAKTTLRSAAVYMGASSSSMPRMARARERSDQSLSSCRSALARRYSTKSSTSIWNAVGSF